jgi:hypothetical protein
VSLTASFLGSKVKQKIICEKCRIYKNSQNDLKITFNKVAKVHENRWKNALFTVNYVIKRFFFSKIHQICTKLASLKDFDEPSIYSYKNAQIMTQNCNPLFETERIKLLFKFSHSLIRTSNLWHMLIHWWACWCSFIILFVFCYNIFFFWFECRKCIIFARSRLKKKKTLAKGKYVFVL